MSTPPPLPLRPYYGGEYQDTAKYLGYNGDDEELTENRGAPWSPILSLFTGALLRTGFVIQLAVMLSGLIIYYSRGGSGIFTFDLFSTPERLRGDTVYNQAVIALQAVALIGVLNIAGFQIYLSDNSKETRGFRAGSKMLCTAATLDTFVVALRLMQHFYAFNFIGTRWWMKYVQTSADWCLLYSSALLHALALALYGLGIFYMDTYYEYSRKQSWGSICLTAFWVTSFLEFLLVFTRLGALLPIVQIVALGTACLWACQFEGAVQKQAPQFHDTDVNWGLSDDNNKEQI